jgi:hypothetical protein
VKYTFRIASLQLKNVIKSLLPFEAPPAPTVLVNYEVFTEEGERIDMLEYHLVEVPLMDGEFPPLLFQIMAKEQFVRRLKARAAVTKQRELRELFEGYEFTCSIDEVIDE